MVATSDGNDCECEDVKSQELERYLDGVKIKERQMIIENKIQCKVCGDIIESCHVHDFKECSCGSCAVDGGREYLRRCWDSSRGEPGDVYEELSVVTNDEEVLHE